MREERQEEESGEQKGLEQREQESSVTLLTVICRPHTRARPSKHRYSHLMYTRKKEIWMNTHAHSAAHRLSAATEDLGSHTHTCTAHTMQTL